MKRLSLQFKISCLVLASIISCAGCSNILVKDPTNKDVTGTSHCSGEEWTDDSALASVPIPVVAFFLPHEDLHDIKADNYLKRCGDSNKLINRNVEVGRGACIPTSLTYLISLGIWQWCPARISWEADVQS